MRIFVIGGGKSIKDYQDKGFNFRLLDNEMTVGTNLAYKLCNLKYLVFIDKRFYLKFKDEILNLSCIKICPNWITQLPEYEERNDFIVFEPIEDILPKRLNKIRAKNNAGVVALRVAYLLGGNPIYLVGIDLEREYFGKKGMHFHNEYPDNWLPHSPVVDYFLDEFVKTINEMKKEGVEIYSCYHNSPLNEYVQYKNLMEVIR